MRHWLTYCNGVRRHRRQLSSFTLQLPRESGRADGRQSQDDGISQDLAGERGATHNFPTMYDNPRHTGVLDSYFRHHDTKTGLHGFTRIHP